MSLLIHATITARGEAADLAACRDDMERALRAQPIEGEAEAHHGGEALCYDLKVKGGLPFPALVEISRAFPGVTIVVEWVNLDAGQRGAATLAGGRLSERDIGALDGQVLAPVCVRLAQDGALALAFAVTRLGADEARGYVLEAGRDAVFRAVRLAGGALELDVTEGAAEWALRCRLSADGAVERKALDPPVAISEAEYSALERMALEFAAEWVWFAEGPEEDNAVERERLRRRGHVERAANLRSAALARVQQRGAQRGEMRVYDTVPDDLRWVETLLARCWVSGA